MCLCVYVGLLRCDLYSIMSPKPSRGLTKKNYDGKSLFSCSFWHVALNLVDPAPNHLTTVIINPDGCQPLYALTYWACVCVCWHMRMCTPTYLCACAYVSIHFSWSADGPLLTCGGKRSWEYDSKSLRAAVTHESNSLNGRAKTPRRGNRRLTRLTAAAITV